MPYAELAADKYLGFYAGQGGLDVTLKATAEEAADAWIDQNFSNYDRSGWVAEGAPPGIRHAALRYTQSRREQIPIAGPAERLVPVAQSIGNLGENQADLGGSLHANIAHRINSTEPRRGSFSPAGEMRAPS